MARKGAAHHFAKMTDETVDQARMRYAQGNISQLDLALEYDISCSTMGRILRYQGWTHVGKAPMARNITLDTNTGYRSVMIFKMDETQELVYHYEGIYDKPGTANQRVSFWRNAGAKLFHDGPEWNKTNIRRGTFYDGWIEKATISWDRVKD